MIMAENKFRQNAEPQPTEQPFEQKGQEPAAIEESTSRNEERKKKRKEKKDKKSSSGKHVMTVLGGTFLIKEEFAKQFPFMMYITVLLMALITNTYIAEETTRQIATTTRQLNDCNVEYIQLRSAIMQASKQSVLARELAPTGIKETVEPLRRINITDKEEQQ